MGRLSSGDEKRGDEMREEKRFMCEKRSHSVGVGAQELKRCIALTSNNSLRIRDTLRALYCTLGM